MDGNFNIQVISRALFETAKCTLISNQSSEGKKRDLTKEKAFICHHSNHWIGIRKIHGVWYNLNSMNSDGPQIISEFYLSALLDNIWRDGFTIFIVDGTLPLHAPSMFKESCKKTQFYFTQEQIQKANDKRTANNNNNINMKGYDQRDHDKLVEQVRREEEGGETQGENKETLEEKVFIGKGVALGGGTESSAAHWYEGDTDPETLQVIKMSLSDVILELN